MVTTITWRTMPRPACGTVVRTIALKDDAPRGSPRGGEDAPWRRMLLAACGEVVTTIALEGVTL